MRKIQIAIDGPAGAGKSTVARQVASNLNYLYIDTGAMFRALTYEAIKANIHFSDAAGLKKLLENTEIHLIQDKVGQKVIVNGEDVTEAIRSQEVTNAVSKVAVHKEVREEMLTRQRFLAKNGGVVMDGRDIGTCVLKDAALKIFLTASVEERARRRFEELLSKGVSTNLDELQTEIELRDRQDSEREIAPLKKAEDAIVIDSTNLSIQEVVNKILGLVKERNG
ncbi:(d)CMP kinase [Pueribacillus theae]|uniref:Cytidylate kinase n=1 Tax=Pueribacillus theae TaxID=2171751 RepID=A0A2U1K4E1_9BACI|nr:(d)CMP kinase [Pueribacillus theae]PWA12391.1 (d)CMP kinase [Pueribacillus theae]